MQEERLRLRAMRVGALPILNAFIERMGLEEELALALKSAGYADALLALVKNILVDRNALYAIGSGPSCSNQVCSRATKSMTTNSDALSIGCLRPIVPPCRRASCLRS